MATASKKDQSARKTNPLFSALKLIIGLLLIGLIGLVITAAVFEQQIASLVINTLNKQLKTELRVSDASLSLIWKFPKAAVFLNDAQLDGVGEHEEKLLDVKSIALECGIIGLLTGSYNFTSISIEEGSLFVHYDKKGKVNYDIFVDSDEEPTTTEENSDLKLSISDATLTNVTLHYVDVAAAYDIKVKATDAYIEGDFIIDNKLNKNKHVLKSYAELFSEYITIGETTYFKGKEIAYDGAVDLDLATEAYNFQDLKLYLQGNLFTMDGSIERNDEGLLYNLTFDSDKALLGALLQLVPENFADNIGQFQSNGRLSFDARINGIQSAKKAPIVEVNFGLKDGRITHPNLDGSMRDVNFDVHFTNGNGVDDWTSKLELLNFQALLNNQPINLNWEVKGIKTPIIKMSMDGKIPLNAVYGFFGEQVTEGDGLIDIAQLSLKGKLSDMMSMYRVPRVNLGGKIVFDQAYLLVNNVPVTVATGDLVLQDNVFGISNFSIKTAESDMLFNGKFQNMLPVLLSDSLNSQQAKLKFEASLNSEKMNIDELLAMGGGHTAEEIEAAPVEEQDSLTKDNLQQRERRTSFLQGVFSTNIKTIQYQELEATNFNGEVAFDNSVMQLRGVRTNAMDGLLKLNSKVYFEKEPSIELFLDCDNIDMREFLVQTKNFGQEAITAENLRGRLNSLIRINMYMDSLGNFQHDKLYMVADLTLLDGEILNLKMLEGFSSFVKMSDLKHIVFTELHNQFKIENSQFIMPAMFIQSNALNLLVGGTYSFNHDMDFHVKINASQVFGNKFKKYNPDKPVIKARQNGLVNIYARILGNLYGDYTYKIGPKYTKESKRFLDEQLASNLPALTNTLALEFSRNKNIADPTSKVNALKQPSQWEDIPEYEGEEGEPLEYLDVQ
ncbi:MAG: AsmA-like C-terminal region-containing protein [Aureispira sp.]